VKGFGTNLKTESSIESTLPDGTKDFTVKIMYNPIVSPSLDAVAFALGAQKDSKWVIITISTVEALAPYDEAKFLEIANTSQFNK
jgi:hypothetical protein